MQVVLLNKTNDCVQVVLLIVLLLLLPVGVVTAGEVANDKAVGYSGTLPVMFIDTDAPITSKSKYVEGRMFIDSMGCKDVPSIGSLMEPIPLKIRGRGNWTWTSFDKKPYKLKLMEGRELLGMPSGKHWALLAHADGQVSFLRNRAGFFLGRRFGMPFTPHEKAVEVVLNGDYIGLYMLTETVRVGKRRVNINKQRDMQTDPDSINGGWLVELDNTWNSNQLRLPVKGKDLLRFWVTLHAPEELSSVQYHYLYDQMSTLLEQVFADDLPNATWTEMLDLGSAARYYLINEMIDHVEAFQGSCYLYKDLEDTEEPRDASKQRWHFGPLWDLGHALNDWHAKDRYIYDNNWGYDISRQLMRYDVMRQEVFRLWRVDGSRSMLDMRNDLHRYADTIRAAYDCNYRRWPAYYRSSIDKVLQQVDRAVIQKLSYLNNLSLSGFVGIDGITVGSRRENGSERTYDVSGRPIKNVPTKGVTIKNGIKRISIK